MGILQGIFKPRDKPKNLGGNSFLWGGTTSGKVVNEKTAMQMTAVYSCVRILSEAIAGLPLFLYKYGEDGSKEKCLARRGEHPAPALGKGIRPHRPTKPQTADDEPAHYQFNSFQRLPHKR